MKKIQSNNYAALSDSRINTLHDISRYLFGICYYGEKKERAPAVYRGGCLKPRSEAILLLGMNSLLNWNISINDLSEYGYPKNLRKSIFAKIDELADAGIYDKPNNLLTDDGLSELRLIIDTVYEHSQDLNNMRPLIKEEIMFLEKNMKNIPEKVLTDNVELSEKYEIVKRIFLDPANTSNLSGIGLENMMLQFKEELADHGLISNGWTSVTSKDNATPEVKNIIERYLARSFKGSSAAQADSLVRGIKDYAYELKKIKKDECGASKVRLSMLEDFTRKNAALIGAIYLKAPELKNENGKNGGANAHEPDMPRSEIRSYLSHINNTLKQLISSDAIETESSRWDLKTLEPLVWLYSGIDLPKDLEKKAFIKNARLFLLHENGDNEYTYAKSFINLDFNEDENPGDRKITAEELATTYPEIAKLNSIVELGRQYSLSFSLDNVSEYGPVNNSDRTDNHKTVAVDIS